MGYIYVYAADADDYDCMGLVGALTPTKCEHEEKAGGMSELTLEHPLDGVEKWKALSEGRIIKAPVPVRTTPEIIDGQVVTSVEKWTVKGTATKAERYVYTKESGGKKKKLLAAGTEVIVVEKGSSRYKIKTGRVTGWIAEAALEYEVEYTIDNSTSSIEEVAPAWTVRDQLFRIYEVEKDMDGGGTVIARARHISYDLLGNLTSYKADNPTAQQALSGILDNCEAAHDFKAYADFSDQRAAIDWKDINPIAALLDPDDGFLAKWGCEFVRDDFELYFLRRAGLNRGARIEYGKNLLGIECKVNLENIATRIKPVGSKKNGDRLYLDDLYVDSAHINDYPTPHIYVLEVDGATVGDGVSEALAKQRMQEAAEKLIEDGCDLPDVNLTVEFINLGDTAEYQQYKSLEEVFLYDAVKVLHKGLGVEVETNVMRTVFNCLTERYEEIELGSIEDVTASISTWQIPSGFSGGKIRYNTLPGSALGDDIISARVIQVDSVTANAIAAGSITAAHMAANVLIAQELIAQIATIVQAVIGRANIGDLTVNYADIADLNATLANLSDARIAAADIDWAQIKDLVAGTAIITEGVGGKLFISRLAVSEANMVSLTAGEMILKGADGRFYALGVDGSGNVTSTLKTVNNDDVTDGSIDAHEKLIERSITADELNVTQIFADSALVRAIKAANLDVDELFANEAFINRLQTHVLTAERIQALKQIIIGGAAGADLSIVAQDGLSLSDSVASTTLVARVTRTGNDVTSEAPAAAFIWTRKSADASGDAAWNANAAHSGVKQITVSGADVTSYATFTLTLLSGEALYGAFSVDTETMQLTQTTGNSYLGYVFGYEGGVLSVDVAGVYELTDEMVLQNADSIADSASAQVTVINRGGVTYAQASEPTGLTASDAGAIWIHSTTGIMKQWNGSAWVSVTVSSVQSGQVVTIDPTNGLTISQPSLGTSMRATANDLGFYYGNTRFAGIGVSNGKGYMEATRLLPPDDSIGYVNLYSIENKSNAFGMAFVIGGAVVGRFEGSTTMLTRFALFADSIAAQNIGNARMDFSTYSTTDYVIMDDDISDVAVVHGHLSPDMDAKYSLGSSVNYKRWYRLYASISSISTSDLRVKVNVRNMGDEALRFVMALKPISYTRSDIHDGQTHTGFGAQDVRAVRGILGLDDWGGFSGQNPDSLALCYEEFIAPLVATVQQQQRRIDALEKRIAALEAKANG